MSGGSTGGGGRQRRKKAKRVPKVREIFPRLDWFAVT
eukprot:COSAG01_NODE_51506_length_354_cov_0.960784_1_plen_36_part_10